MSRNQRKQETIHQQTLHPWFWLLVGLLIGTLGVLLLPSPDWLPWGQEAPAQNKTSLLQSTTEIEGTSTAQIKPPHFKFYTLLPEMEVAAPGFKPKQSSSQPQSPPQPETAETETEVAPSPKPESASSSNPEPAAYVLQAGSFHTYAQADKREAFLALMGVQSAIQTVTTDNNKTWHRVRIGPSTNLSKLRRIRQQLHKNQIKSLLYKVSS